MVAGEADEYLRRRKPYIYTIPINKLKGDNTEMYSNPITGVSEEARNLAREAMQGEVVLDKGGRLIANDREYIANHDSEETRRVKRQAFNDLVKVGFLFVSRLHTDGTTEYGINRALANNVL